MVRRRLFHILLPIIFGLAVSACSILNTPDKAVDYASIEQTVSAHLTQTFEAMPTATNTFTPVPTSTYTPEPTATDIPTATENLDEFLISRNEELTPTIPPEPTATIVFPDKADFVMVLPSPNQFVPDQHFYLTWQIKNTGTSTWSGKYDFHYSSGIQLADQTSYEITNVVEPGGLLTITMPAKAPSSEGTYQTTWVLENPDGIVFYNVYYTVIVGDQTFITEVPELNPTATVSSLEWMCTDPERSMVQGDGCLTYCSPEVVAEYEKNGVGCYALGERVKYE